jgi:hypothetical protein
MGQLEDKVAIVNGRRIGNWRSLCGHIGARGCQSGGYRFG